jgi:putative transposase
VRFGFTDHDRTLSFDGTDFEPESGARRNRPPSARASADAALTEKMAAFPARSGGTYGAPRIHADLAEAGIPVGRKRVERLMRAAGPAGVSRRRFARTTIRDERVRPAADLVDRVVTATTPDRLWGEPSSAIGPRTMASDITYIATWTGFLYLAVVLDAFSRKIVGWAMASGLRAQLVLDALNMAIGQRRPHEVIHHSDQGSQCTSVAFGLRCKEAGVRPSAGSVGDAYDHARASSPPSNVAPPAPQLPDQGRGAHGSLRLHGTLVQSEPAALGPRLQITRRVRKERP